MCRWLCFLQDADQQIELHAYVASNEPCAKVKSATAKLLLAKHANIPFQEYSEISGNLNNLETRGILKRRDVTGVKDVEATALDWNFQKKAPKSKVE